MLYHFLDKGSHGLTKLLLFSLAWWLIIGLGSKYSEWIEMLKMPLDRLPIFMAGIFCGRLAMKKRALNRWIILIFLFTGYFLFFLQKRTALNSLSFVLYYPIRAFLGISIISTIIFAMEVLQRISDPVFKGLSGCLKWLGGLTLECYLFHQSYLLLFDFPYKLPQYVITAFILPVLSAALVFWLRAVSRKKVTM